MKVSELIEALQECDPELEIVMCAQPGGDPNSSPVCEATEMLYLADSTWAGNVYDEEDGSELEGVVPAIVLWPTW